MFNSLLRALLEGYLKFCLSTFLLVREKKLDTASDKVKLIASGILIVVFIILPILDYLFLKKN